MSPSTLRRLTGIIILTVLILSCSLLENVAPKNKETESSGDSGSEKTVEDPRVQESLGLRSVRMELETTFPGKYPTIILISIDMDGNQKIEMAIPLPEGSSDPSDSPEANILEIYMIDGAAYSRMGKEGQAESSPEQIDALHRILYNPAGPGMWLLLLPKGSFTSSGSEVRGGFQAVRYSVDGSIEEGTIRGDIWLDDQTDALVGANLSVSESLFHAGGSGSSGSVSIILTVEKAEIAAITLP
jgi:hypothetical protein